MYRWLRALLFLLPAERAHAFGMAGLRWLGRFGVLRRRVRRRLLPDLPELHTALFGLSFPTPLGVAAGLDKEGSAAGGLFALGFGFVEVGTLTPRPQPGNAKPRLFRAPGDGALVNRMGFNNPGIDVGATHLAGRSWPGPLGVNIGKNKDTPEEGAVEDYLRAARGAAAVGDYVAINVSSPNTPGLRNFQRAELLYPLLSALRQALPAKPLLLKFAPDLETAEIEALCDVAQATQVSGLIATNTTLSRPSNAAPYGEAGGLSGRPLADLATRSLRIAASRLKGALPIIGVGGLWSGADLFQRLQNGASLLQGYTAFIYQGPGWAGQVTLELATLLRRAGFRTVAEAVGHNAAR